MTTSCVDTKPIAKKRNFILAISWLIALGSCLQFGIIPLFYCIPALILLHKWRKSGNLLSLGINLNVDRGNWMKWYWLGAAGIVLAHISTLYYILPYVLENFPGYRHYFERYWYFVGMRGEFSFTAVLMTAILAPWLEEVFFRGFLLRKFGKIGWYLGATLSSLIFGVLHPNMLGLTVFGFILCLVATRTGSLAMPMVIHAANNIGAILDGFTSNGGYFGDFLLNNAYCFPWKFLLVMTCVFGIVGIVLKNWLRKKSERVDLEPHFREFKPTSWQ